MKKISLLLFLTLLFMPSLSSCGTVNNEEFDEYSKKIITVLDDYNINVNNETKNTKRKSLNPKMKFNDSKNEILNILNNSERFDKNIENSIQESFEQTFYFPLVMGEALKTGNKVNDFYGEIARILDNQYIVTNKDSNVFTTLAYVEQTDYISYVVMELTYNSETDYFFKGIQFTDDNAEQTYFYGDSSQMFFKMYISPDLSQIEYQENMEMGYSCADNSVISEISNLLSDEFTQYSKQTFKDLKLNCEHIVSKDDYDNALEKYFGYTGPTIVDKEALETDGNCALSYIATQNEETVTIPNNIEYLSFDFNVRDETGKVKTLFIPKSVKGIKKGNEVVSVDNLELMLIKNNQSGLFENIIVEEGSTLLKSDDFKLTSYDGETLLYIFGKNTGSTALDLSMCTKASMMLNSNFNGKIFENLNSLTYNLMDTPYGEKVDLLSLYSSYCFMNNREFKINLEEVIVGNINAENQGFLALNSMMEWNVESNISNLTLKGTFEQINVYDPNGIIKSINIDSTFNEAKLTGVLNGLKEIVINSDDTIEYYSEYVTELVVSEGVTIFNFDILLNVKSESLSVHLPSTLITIDGYLPDIPEGSVGKYKILVKESLALTNGEFEELMNSKANASDWIIEYL